MSITADDLDDLRHMLGAEPDRSRKSWGYRNYYCGHSPSMERLVAAGFARLASPATALYPYPFYAATREGCRAVGMTDAEIKRMENEK